MVGPRELVHSGDSVKCTCHLGKRLDRAEGASDSRRRQMKRSSGCPQEGEAKAAAEQAAAAPEN